MIFRPILGLVHVWDSLLVSHIKVGGKYNFSSPAAGIFGVSGHVAETLI